MRERTKAQFLNHEPCPRCRSRDNLGRYSDGSAFCFGGCGYYEKPKHKPQNIKKETKTFELTDKIPTIYKNHMKNYITPKAEQHFKYNEKYDRLTFKYNDYYEHRSLSEKPKTISNGVKPNVIFYDSEPSTSVHNTLVVVEDIFSCLKISSIPFPSFCLFGSNPSLSQKLYIVKHCKELIIWLDYDKYEEAIKLQREFNNWVSTSVIHTQKDPKDYETYDLKIYLGV